MSFGGRFTARSKYLFTVTSAQPQQQLFCVLVILVLLSFGWPASDANAHAASWSINTDAEPLTIDFRYTDGRPMVLANIKVMTAEGRVLQIGNADRDGRFSFVPDESASGAPWAVIAKDDEGHEITATIAADSVAKIINRRAGMSSSLVWLLVASVLINIAVLCTFVERRWRRD